MHGDLSGDPLAGGTEGAVRKPAPPRLSAAVRGRLQALLVEFTSAIATMEDGLITLESISGTRPDSGKRDRSPSHGTKSQSLSFTQVTLDLSVDESSFIDELYDAVATIAGVQRIRISETGERRATFLVTIEAAPTATESLMTFRDSLSEIAGIQRVLLTEFAGDHAVFVVTAESSRREGPATEPHSVVCAGCGRILTVGGGIVSHGFCSDCAARAARGTSGAESPLPLGPTIGSIVYLQRNADVWQERLQDENGRTHATPYPGDLPAQTVLEGISARNPGRLVVLTGQAEAAGETRNTSVSAGPDADEPAPPSPPRRMRNRRPRGQTDLGLKRLRQTLSRAVPVDPDLLLEALASIHATVDGVANRSDLPGDAAWELAGSVSRLQETIDSIQRLAVASSPNAGR